MKYYLAYGSNLNMEQMYWRCPDAEEIGTGEIQGYRLMYKGSKTGSYLTIEPEKGGRVPVGVWKISEDDEKNLDRYEGCPNFYYKKEIPITVKIFGTKKTKKVKAIVYIMHEERSLGLPSKFYRAVCRAGYYDFGLDQNILEEAYNYTKEAIENG